MSATPLATACRGCGSHLGLYIADSPYCVDCEDHMPTTTDRCPNCNARWWWEDDRLPGPRCANGFHVEPRPTPERPSDCPTCRGRLEIDLPIQMGPDDFDTIERPCPTCCPQAWPNGFPGLKGIASGRRWWLIEPTGSHAGKEA